MSERCLLLVLCVGIVSGCGKGDKRVDPSATAATGDPAQRTEAEPSDKAAEKGSECREKLIGAEKAIVAAQTELAGMRTSLSEAKQALQTAEAAVREKDIQLKEYSQSPGAVYQEVIAAVAAVATTADVDAVRATIKEFGTRFPGAAESKALRKQSKALKRTRRGLAAAEAKAKAEESISALRDLMANSEGDGSTLDIQTAVTVAEYLKGKGLNYAAINQLPKGSFAEAMKDIAGERGRRIVASGSIVQISKDGDYFRGIMCKGSFCDKVYYFVTPGTTRGIVQRKRATFSGVIMQRMAYSNAGGGTTHAVVLVGYFKGQN